MLNTYILSMHIFAHKGAWTFSSVAGFPSIHTILARYQKYVISNIILSPVRFQATSSFKLDAGDWNFHKHTYIEVTNGYKFQISTDSPPLNWIGPVTAVLKRVSMCLFEHTMWPKSTLCTIRAFEHPSTNQFKCFLNLNITADTNQSVRQKQTKNLIQM